MDDAQREYYQAVILDHSKHPRHYGALAGATHQAEGKNPNCGDELKVYVKMEDERVDDVSFEGEGCAICKASASMMTEEVYGKPWKEVQEEAKCIRGMFEGDEWGAGKDLEALKGVREYPARVACALLAWEVLEKAVGLDGK